MPAPSSRRAASSTTDNTSEKQREDEELRPYISVANIGKGSFATVYKGYHEVSLPPFCKYSCLEATIFT
jgi:serine/threonine-protein kinase ULK/ATG1